MLALAAGLVLGSPAPPEAHAQQAGAPPPGSADVWASTLTGRSKSDPTPIFKIAEGQVGALYLGVRFNAPGASTGQVTTTLTVPEGLTLVGATAQQHGVASTSAAWSCAQGGQAVTCNLVQAGGTTPFVLQPQQTMHLVPVFRAAPGLDPSPPPTGTSQPAATSTPLGSITYAASVPTANGTLVQSTSFPVDATSGTLLPDPHTSLIYPDPPPGRATASYQFRVANIGGSPAQSSAGTPALALSNILPPRRLAGVTISGPGWACSTAGRGSCTYRRPIAVGDSASILTVRWSRGPDAPALSARWQLAGALGHAITQSGAPPPGASGSSQSDRESGSFPFSHKVILQVDDTRADLALRVGTPQGVLLRGGDTRGIVVRIRNTGSLNAPGPGFSLALPAGVSAGTTTPGWSCTGQAPRATCMGSSTLAEGASASVAVTLSGAESLGDARRTLTLAPLGRDGTRRGGARTIPLRLMDAGDPLATPELQVQRSGQWVPWSNGGRQRIVAGAPFAYRVAIVNRGAYALAQGARVSIGQALGPEVALKQVSGSPGVSCAQGPRVSCTLVPQAPVNPGGTAGWVQVTIVAKRPAERLGTGDIGTQVAGQPGSESLPVPLRAVANPRTLAPTLAVTRVPSAGGVGAMRVAVTNRDSVAAAGVSARMVLPAGVSVSTVRGTGWQCRVSGRTVGCALGAALASRRTTAPVTLGLRAAASMRPARPDVQWQVTGRRATDGAPRVGSAVGPLPVRGPIRVAAEAQPTVLAVSRNRSRPRSVVLKGSESMGNGVSLDYAWRQRCLSPADAGPCGGRVTPRVTVRGPGAATAKAEIPSVSVRTRFAFTLTITDGSATRDQTVTVTAAAPQRISRSPAAAPRASGQSRAAEQRVAALRQQQRARALALRRADAMATAERRATFRRQAGRAEMASTSAPGVAISGAPLIASATSAAVSLSASTTGQWTGSVSWKWTQVGGTSAEPSDAATATAKVTTPGQPAILTYRVTATSSSGQVAEAQVVVSSGSTTTQGFCSLITKAQSAVKAGSKVAASLGGGAQATFGVIKNLTTRGSSACTPTARFNFSSSSFSVGGVQVTGASGSVGVAGIAITGGSVTTPGAWRLPALSMGAGDSLALAFVGTSGSSVALGGSVAAPGFAFLPLPGGWSGVTTLMFAASESGSSGAVSSTARGGSGGTVSLAGSISTGGNYSATVIADDLVSIGGSPIDLSGTASMSGGQVTSSITGGLGGPVTLAPGVSITTLTATWTPNAPNGVAVTGSGSLALQSGGESPASLNVGLSYSSSSTWKVTVTGSGGPSWGPVPGLSITPSDFSGSVGQASGAWQWNLQAEIPSWRVASVLTLSDLTFDLSNTCSGNQPTCPNAKMFMGISTSAKLTPPVGDGFTASAKAILGMGGPGGFSLWAGVQDLNLGPGINLGSPSFQVAYGMPSGAIPSTVGAPSFAGAVENGFSMVTTGSLSVPGLGSFGSIAANITSQGWSLGGFDPNGVSLGSGNGGQSNASFGWSSFPTSMTVSIPGFGQQQIPVGGGSIAVAGGYAVPSWFSTVARSVPDLALGTISFNPTNGFFDAQITIPGNFTLPAGGSTLQVPSLFFSLQNSASGLVVSAGGIADLGVQAMGGGTQQAPQLEVDMSFDVTTQTVSGSFTFIDQAGWQNAFGDTGLTVNEASITLGIQIDTLVPTLAMYASGALPGDLTSAFSVPSSGIPIAIGAELSDTNPCIDVQVGSSTGTQPVLSVDGGALTANYFEFILAPSGCQLAPDVTIQPGYQMAFDGAVLGTTVDVSASLGFDPTTFNASVTVGAFKLGGLQFEQTNVTVAINEATQTDDVSFSGGFEMFGSTISVSGSLDYSGQTRTTTAALTVSQAQALTVDGFSLSNLNVTANVTNGPGVDDISIAASGAMDVLGNSVDVQAFDATIDNGVVEQVTVDVQASINVAGTITASGTFDMDYSQTTGQFDLDASVTMQSAGFQLGTAAQPATLDISPQCASFQGSLSVAGVFQATLEGTVVSQSGCPFQVQNAAGQMVSGAPGDFSFAADNVGITVGGFDATGSVGFGNVAGDAYAQVQTELKLSPQSTNDTVQVAGEFQGNGDFSFVGSATLALAGFDLDTQVNASRQAGSVNVSGSTTMNLGGTNVNLLGQFSMQGNTPSAVLSASVNPLQIAGFNLGSGQVTLYDTPQQVGVSASANLTAGSPSTALATMSGQLSFIAGPASTPLFYVSLDGSLLIPAISGQPSTLDAIFTNCTDSTCQAQAPVSFSMAGSLNVENTNFTFNTPFSINPDGGFNASTSTSGNDCSPTSDILGVNWQACFDYSENLTISSGPPYFAVGGSDTADVQSQAWDPFINWGVIGYVYIWPFGNQPVYGWAGGWGPWTNWAIGISGSFQVDPFQACVGVTGGQVCIP